MGRCCAEPRRALHARIAEAIESQFTEIAESRPELVARHCTEAGLIEKAAGLWGKRVSGRWSARPTLRREQIKLQVDLNAAPETKRAAEQARLLIEQAEALGERPEDPLLCSRFFSALTL
jgi:hypothetical protein